MNVPLRKSITCISQRSKTVEVKYRSLSKGPLHHITIDSTLRSVSILIL